MPILVTVKDPDLHIDPDFPHDSRSVGDSLDPTLRWIPVRRLRPDVAFPDWCLFDGVEPADLLQGALGDCWLIAAMAVLAEYPDTVRSLFLRPNNSDKGHVPRNGMYVIRLFDYTSNSFRDVTVDEYVPYQPSTGLCEFAKPHGNEVWVLLLEKAMAKVMGSYAALQSGNAGVAFRAFTGEQNIGLWQRRASSTDWKELKLQEGGTAFAAAADQQQRNSDSFFDALLDFCGRNYLMCTSIGAKVAKAEDVRRDGLIEGHAYSILSVVELEGQRLIKMRNPWGNATEWNGAWSDKSNSWVKFPIVKARLRPQQGPDGIFWMAWADFANNFTGVYVCYKAMHGRAGAAFSEGEISKRLTAEKRRLYVREEIERCFKIRDRDRDQVLNPAELAEVMADLGMDGSKANKLVKVVDVNSDGKVDLQEFLDWVLGDSSTAQKKASQVALNRAIGHNLRMGMNPLGDDKDEKNKIYDGM